MNFNKNGIINAKINEIIITDKSIKQLQYIDADATSYIKTDYSGSDNYLIDCKMEILGTVNSNYWFGQTLAHGAMMYNGLYNNRSLEYNWLTVSFTNSNLVEMSLTQINSTLVNININGQEFIRDIGTNDGTGNFLIFACNNVRYYGSNMRFWYLRMHVGNRYLLNLLPALNNNNAGMYDTINQKFYANSGTGMISAGPELIVPSIYTDKIIANNFNEF